MATTCHLYRNGVLTEETFDPTKISDALPEEGTLVWLDLEDPSEDELRMIQGEFGIPKVEAEVFGEQASTDVQLLIFQEKKRLLEFRRRVLPLREVLDLLQEERAVVTPRLRAEYKDVADHVVRTLELVESVGELLSTALDAHLSRVGHQLNQIIKKLTSWAAIILVPTVIAGIYGMNFLRPFPAFTHPYGFWIAIGMMVVSGGALYWMFRKRDWI